jgi:Druantia protein DruA
MDCVLRYRGQNITSAQVQFIGQLIAAHPGLSRRKLSTKLCQAWNWVQANGQLRTMVCRGLMLQLHRAGLIELPPVRWLVSNPLAQRRKPAPVLSLNGEPIQRPLRDLGSVEIRQVRRRPEEKLFGSLMQAHHYLAYTQPVGEHLKHLVYIRDIPIACLAWSSAPRHLGPRDRFIGWSKEQRRTGLHWLAYNTRFLILPWVEVPHLASYLLGRVARVISEDWQRLYHHPIYLLETFIDPERFRGTAYRAANWIYLGKTTGRGKDDLTHRANRCLKELWVRPLVEDFRDRLAPGHG